MTPGHAILASNTSSLSITEMGEATGRPELVVGFHYFYPASVMRLVEVVEGEDTAPATVQAAVNFAQAIRKMPIRCGWGFPSGTGTATIWSWIPPDSTTRPG